MIQSELWNTQYPSEIHSRGFTQLRFTINALSKKKREMRRAIRKPQDIPFKRFSTRLTELNNYLPLLPGSRAAKKMPPEELNEILLRAVPNVWAKQAYQKGWDFEMKIYKDMCELFEGMEVAEKIYKGRNTSKNPPREGANRASHGRKRNVGEAASPTNPETGRSVKLKTRNTGHPIDRPTGGKKCLLHCPGHSTEECKVLKDYSTNYATQRPHKE